MRPTTRFMLLGAVAMMALTGPARASDSGINLQFKPTETPVTLRLPTGLYRCELNRNVHVRHVAEDGQSAILLWNRREYTLRAVDARTGALRYEDPASGLVWLVIVGKSMLLDSKAGKQLANECTI